MGRVDIIPSELQGIKSPPKELYFLGDLNLLKRRKVSIVGTRRPIQYTKIKTYEIAKKLSSRGVVVVSGGAMGVDAISHDGAGENTICVCANSLDIIYPKINTTLLRRIYNKSLALSEYEPTFKATRYSFVQRNRLVVGLGEVLIITQADENSGSLRSAEYAIEEGKEIYVLPHRLDESKGTQELLKEGMAKPIHDIDDFVNLFGEEELSPEDDIEKLKGISLLRDALAILGDKIFEMEIEGRVSIENGRIKLL